MDERERKRLMVTREIAKLLRYRSFRAALPPLGPDGSAPFIVGLADDTLRDIGVRVTAMGGEAHLILPVGPITADAVRLRILRFSEAGGKEISDLDDEHECAVSEDSTLAMLMEHLEVGGELTYHTYAVGTVVRFINDSIQPIPA